MSLAAKKRERGGFSVPFYSPPPARRRRRRKKGRKRDKICILDGRGKERGKGGELLLHPSPPFHPQEKEVFLLLSLFPYVAAAKWGSFSLLFFLWAVVFSDFRISKKGKVSKKKYETLC